MKYTIYLRTNLINGKHYVGQTNNFKRRERDWHCFKVTYANKHIDADREEYGLDNWSVEILNECDTREEAWQLEQYYIDKFNSIYPNGYNLAKGGSGTNGCYHSEETRKKISESLKGENSPMFGKQRSEETKKKISDSHSKKKVYQYALDGELVKIWESTNECGRNGFKQSAVSRCCNGIYKHYKGYRWSF